MTTDTETIAMTVDDVQSLPDARWRAARKAGTQAGLLNDPDVKGAMRIRENPYQAGQVEAFVLAGAPPEAIANFCGYPIGWVKAYEYLFYDIRSRLHDRDWILKHAIDRRYPDRFENDEVPAFLQVYGFTHGQVLLEELLQTYELHTLAEEGLENVMVELGIEN
jgi:hypothetical protein